MLLVSKNMFGRSISIFALIAPLFFPWQYVVLITLIASWRYPPVALVVGIEMDALYFAHGAVGITYASLWGFVAMLAFFALRRFVHTHILMT